MRKINIYTDGGVVLKNPSSIGGTWAYVIPHGNKVYRQESGFMSYGLFPGKVVTNNQMELVAVIQAFMFLLPNAKNVHVYSDSEVTLGRVFKEHSLNNIPFWMTFALKREQEKFTYFDTFKYTLLAGHPTKKHLETGIGRNGHPVSKWNVLADKLCKFEAKESLK